MRKPVAITAPYRVSKDDFNDTEKLSKVKQEIIRNPSKEAQLIAEVTVLTELVRALSGRVKELESK